MTAYAAEQRSGVLWVGVRWLNPLSQDNTPNRAVWALFERRL